MSRVLTSNPARIVPICRYEHLGVYGHDVMNGKGEIDGHRSTVRTSPSRSAGISWFVAYADVGLFRAKQEFLT
jgi:hypothetical protein